MGSSIAGYTELKIKGVYPSLREQGGVTDAECQKLNQFGKILGFFPTGNRGGWGGIGSELFSSV